MAPALNHPVQPFKEKVVHLTAFGERDFPQAVFHRVGNVEARFADAGPCVGRIAVARLLPKGPRYLGQVTAAAVGHYVPSTTLCHAFLQFHRTFFQQVSMLSKMLTSVGGVCGRMIFSTFPLLSLTPDQLTRQL